MNGQWSREMQVDLRGDRRRGRRRRAERAAIGPIRRCGEGTISSHRAAL